MVTIVGVPVVKVSESYQLVFLLKIEMLITEKDSFRLLSKILEGVNYMELYFN